MQSAFVKDILRSIRGSMGRFLAIMGIVALGCGFYAGLQMCGPNMRADADALYDGTNLWDLRLISTLGFSDDDVERVRTVEGVSHVMPSLSCDAMARLGTEQVAVRISSLDVEAARASSYDPPYTVNSSNDDYLNRPVLVEGRWPQAAGECVISADVAREDYGIGDEVVLLNVSDDVSDLLGVTTFVVVGTVSSSDYPYNASFGSTNLGSGQIDQYLYVVPTSLAQDAPYTQIYLTVEGAARELSESDAYQRVVNATKGRLEQMSAGLSAARQADLKAKAQAKLDEKWAEYHDEKAKAEQELADARAKLDDAAAQLADGERQLADGEADYASGLAEFESQRDSTYAQLDAAQAEIDRNQATIDEKARELETGLAELDQAQRQLDESEEALVAGRRELEASKVQLAQGEAELDQGQAELDARRAKVEARLAEGAAAWEAQRAPLARASENLGICLQVAQTLQELLEAQTPPTPEQVETLQKQLKASTVAVKELRESGLFEEQAELLARLAVTLDSLLKGFEGVDPQDATAVAALLAQLRTATQELPLLLVAIQQAKAPLDEAIATGDEKLAQESAAARSQLDEAQATIDARRAELEEGRVRVQAAQARIDEGTAQLEAGRQRVAAGLAQAQEGSAQLADGRRQLDLGRMELMNARRAAREALDGARAQLDDAAAQLADARAELEDGRREYEDGVREYLDGKAEADEKLGDALTQLTDAQHEIDDIERPDIYVLDRTKSEGAAIYHADTLRIDAIADVFPFIFFLVAALVSLTTMTRMVEDERILIGTYKALGYGTAAIAAKYLAYAGVAGVVGATVGIVVLAQVLPYIVMSSYGIIYTIPIHPFPLPIYPGIALLSGGLGVGVTLLATWGAVLSSLREVPATLMLPRAPKAGKRILLERIAPIWSRLSFTWKVTCRNLFRYKRRFLMTVIGISGCTALLLVGFGLHDAIWDIIDCQYGPIVHYDTTVGLADTAIELDVRKVCDYLAATGEVTDIVRVQNENMQAGAPGKSETIRVNVVIPHSPQEMAQAITFKNRLSGEQLAFDDSSVFITEKLSLKFGLDVGDSIVLYTQDDVGNAVGEGHRLAITGVAENYVGNYVYVGRDAWRQVNEVAPVYSTIYASTTNDPSVRARVTNELRARDDVSTVIFSTETIDMYRKMLSVVDLIVVVLIVSAAALAYIVLYNLTNINIGERIREIASLKVLGFTRSEVYTYIFREILLLALIGDVCGMALGILLERFVVVTAEVDYVMFGRSIHGPSFAYSFALTMLFAVLVVLSMRRKLDRVDMVESLKSVD